MHAPGNRCHLKAIVDDLDANPYRLNIIQKSRGPQQPGSIVHGDADPTVPVSHAKGSKQQTDAELLIVIKSPRITLLAVRIPLWERYFAWRR